MEKVDLLTICYGAAINKKAKEIATEFDFSFKEIFKIEDLNENISAKLILIDNFEFVAPVKQYAPLSEVVMILPKKIDETLIKIYREAGVDQFFLEEDLFKTSKLEFYSVNVIKTSFIAIKPSELNLSEALYFSAHTLLPINGKFVPIIHPGVVLDETRKAKVLALNELYVKRKDIEKYKEYLTKVSHNGQQRLNAQCRAEYINLSIKYVNLVLKISDQVESSSFSNGQEFLEDCLNLSKGFLNSLEFCENIYKVIDNNLDCDFGDASRLPAVISHIGSIGMDSDFPNLDKIILAAFLSDIGLVNLPYEINKKLKARKESQFTPEEKELYESHPFVSINLCANKKIALDDDVKKFILQTHERVDRQGFPSRPLPERISLESQLIHYCQHLDYLCVNKIGEPTKNIHEIKKKLFQEEFLNSSRFSLSFLRYIKKAEAA